MLYTDFQGTTVDARGTTKGEVLREVGRRLAGVRAPLFKGATEAEPRERLKIAVDVLKDLGGLAELEDTGDEIVIRCFNVCKGYSDLA